MVKKVKKAKSTKKTTKKVSKKPAKKTVKKTVKKMAKKPAKKVSKKPTKKYVKAKGDQRFFLVDGTVISNLFELADALDMMGHEMFYHHVDGDRNDFSNWVRDILKEAELADKLLEETTPERCQIRILRHFLN